MVDDGGELKCEVGGGGSRRGISIIRLHKYNNIIMDII